MKKFISLFLSVICLCGAMLPLGLTVSAKDNIADKDIFEYIKRENEDVEGADPVIYITGLKEEVEGELVLPMKISGGKVAYIENGAFSGCDKLTSVILPPYTSVIGDEAFKDCTNLKEITIPDGVITICDRAFENCSSLETIFSYGGFPVFDDGPYWSGSDVFEGCVSLKTIELPVDVSNIYSPMFDDCINLETLYLPSNVTSIENGAFDNCPNLSNIYFRSSFHPEFDEYAVSKNINLYFSGSYAEDWEVVKSAGYILETFDNSYDFGPECYQKKSPVGFIVAGVAVAVAIGAAVTVVVIKNKKKKAQ